jgi:uncharacterized protein YkwD
MRLDDPQKPTGGKILDRFKYQIDESNIRYNDPNAVQTKIQDYRNKKKAEWLNSRKFKPENVMTMGQLETRIQLEDEVGFGKECLKLTNEFRAQQNLPPVKWNEELYRVGRPHSIKMAEKKIPLGHQGFDNRARECKLSKKSFAENVAYCNNYPREQIPKVRFLGSEKIDYRGWLDQFAGT